MMCSVNGVLVVSLFFVLAADVERCISRVSRHLFDAYLFFCLDICMFGFIVYFFFFFQAEDGIRDRTVTGVQTCALPICSGRKIALCSSNEQVSRSYRSPARNCTGVIFPEKRNLDLASRRRCSPSEWRKIGRASCRERV